MRDLGVMGESVFSLWCAHAGLIANGSVIDKTGWDFLVEFPFESNASQSTIHNSAFECKIQVKATDKKDRKLPIKLSNLRRLVTAHMPAFFVFIEFDKKESPQRVFVVHVDYVMISRVLKRLLELEQKSITDYNKRTMTIHYNDSHQLSSISGGALKSCLENNIGGSLSKYIVDKKAHLESTGYDNGYSQITFRSVGVENIKALIDLSLGIKHKVAVSKLKGVDTRFGITSTKPFLNSENAEIKIPNVSSDTDGIVRFKVDKLERGLSFMVKLYCSQFNAMLPNELKKVRFKGEFFELLFNPITGASNFSFSFEGIRLSVQKFKDALVLLSLLSESGKKLFVDLIFDEFPKQNLELIGKDLGFSFSRELKILENAIEVMFYFGVSEDVNVCYNEILRDETSICQMHQIISSPTLFKVEFEVDAKVLKKDRNGACVFSVFSTIGSYRFIMLLVLIGEFVESKNGGYSITSKDITIEKKIVLESNDSIDNKDIVAAIEEIEEKYVGAFTVVTIFDKNCN